MPQSSSIITYIENAITEDLEDGKLLISPSRHEKALRIVVRDNAVDKFCKLAVDDVLIRLLVFLRCSSMLEPNRDYPLVIQYPLFVTMDEQWLEQSIADTGEKILEELTKKRDDAQTNAKESSWSIIYRIMRTIYEDGSFRRRLLKGRIPRGKDAETFFTRLMDRHRQQAEELVDETRDLYSANEAVMERFQPVIYALKRARDAKINHLILKRGCDISQNTSLLADSLARIEAGRSIRMRILSICLECLTRHNLDPYILLQLYPGTPEIISKCHKCSGNTIFTSIALEIPSSMVQLFYEGFILDLIVAYVLANSKKIQRIYIHKSVKAVVSGQEMKPREIDILAITHENRAIAIDVNGTSVRGEVFSRANELRQICEELPISKLICINADPTLDEYSQYGANTIVMHAKHLANLTEFVDGVI